jgi:hypothetical protein
MKYPNKPIQKGEKDKTIVNAVQKELNKKGYGPIKIDGDFGTKTQSAVKLFQAQNTDKYGNVLVSDGILGPISWASLFGENTVIKTDKVSSVLAKQALKGAISQLGVREKGGANSGPEVEKYLKSIGLGKGYPWCMAFMYWCFSEASKNLNIANPLVQTGGVMNGWNKATCKKILARDSKIDYSLVKPGHIFIMDFGGGKGHTGIVKSIDGGYITTIEGNTNVGRSREGIGVFELKRKIKDINKGFLEY